MAFEVSSNPSDSMTYLSFSVQDTFVILKWTQNLYLPCLSTKGLSWIASMKAFSYETEERLVNRAS